VPSPTDWLTDAVVYEIYPQSFADSNGDGIGDLPGAFEHLDHLQWLGVDTVWFNPCFDSPFRDAGYDVSDYLRVAPRYGTNEDLERFVEEARKRGIRVLLDLVVGHTSDQHPWFLASIDDPDDHRYIWADREPPTRTQQLHDAPVSEDNPSVWVPSPGSRPGFYRRNFYASQPALNFGYARLDPDEPWRQPVDAPGPQANRAALREVMDFWLSRGVAGFRVDMAFSLVKDDPGFVESAALWREMRRWLAERHPEAVLIPEGEEPIEPEGHAFHADFFLVIEPAHHSLFGNGGAGTLPWIPPTPCFFDEAAQGTPQTFLDIWNHRRSVVGTDRPILLATADHDFSRLACGTRTAEQLPVAYAFLLTWPSVPSIYYGDEIGMRYQPGLPDVEGSVIHKTYNRVGCRTPMQWDDGPNAGFSTAPADRLYLPVDPAPDRPTVAEQRADEGSLLHLVRRLIALRRTTPALQPRAEVEVLNAGYPFAYLRGGTHLVVLNPGRAPVSLDVRSVRGVGAGRVLEGSGVELGDDTVLVDGFGWAVVELAR
jgi:maltose alpha-D-glucosyltransferase/alpha-amylase